MKINWKIRLKNKAFWIMICPMIVAFIYQVLAAFNVVPKISENLIVELIMMLINLVAAMGIIVDPTTKGLSDSNRALGYEELG